MSLCLSRDEIAELTRAQTRKRQVAFLRANGIRHYVDAYGWPVVTRSAVEGDRSKPMDSGAWQSSKVAKAA